MWPSVQRLPISKTLRKKPFIILPPPSSWWRKNEVGGGFLKAGGVACGSRAQPSVLKNKSWKRKNTFISIPSPHLRSDLTSSVIEDNRGMGGDLTFRVADGERLELPLRGGEGACSILFLYFIIPCIFYSWGGCWFFFCDWKIPGSGRIKMFRSFVFRGEKK